MLVCLPTLVFPAEPAAPGFGPYGIQVAAHDASVRPGDDFYSYANGHWLTTEQMPSDRSRWGSFEELRLQAVHDVRSVIEAAAASSPAPGSNARKIADFYQAFLDTGTIEKLGLAPAIPGLKAIAALTTHAQAAALIATPGMLLDGPIGHRITLDQKNPDRYVVGIGQSGLSLPDREYYLKTDAQFADIRARFQAHIQKILALAGHRDAASEAAQILALETVIAKLHWDRAQRRNRDLTYNLMSLEALQTEAPDYPWSATLKASGLTGVKEVVVAEKSALGPLARLFKQTPLATLKSYLAYRLLTQTASVLPKAFDEENFDFNGRVLNGQPQQLERWERSVDATDSALGEAVGQLYVEKKFPPQSKASMETLVENLRRAYAQHIENVPWMTAETKQVALQKLAAFRPKIGYPSKWRDYTDLQVRPGDAFGNEQRAEIFAWKRQVARLDKPTDREEWRMTPQTVNAYYNPVFNEVVFPAAILQPPFFNPEADPAVNYGGIGAVIGHEMGHGFDDQGAKSDAKGVLRNWWQPQDVDAFKIRTEKLATQYDQFKPFEDLHLNGHLTLGENIGDLGGLSIAYDAYKLFLNGATAPVIDGSTADQRFFFSWAQCFRTLQRDAALRRQVLSDSHSPGEYRVNGVVRNIDAWYSAFDVKPGDKLYLSPDERVRIW
jgi:putative endopeptidase